MVDCVCSRKDPAWTAPEVPTAGRTIPTPHHRCPRSWRGKLRREVGSCRRPLPRAGGVCTAGIFSAEMLPRILCSRLCLPIYLLKEGVLTGVKWVRRSVSHCASNQAAGVTGGHPPWAPASRMGRETSQPSPSNQKPQSCSGSPGSLSKHFIYPGISKQFISDMAFL